jgi:hypothetical protein
MPIASNATAIQTAVGRLFQFRELWQRLAQSARKRMQLEGPSAYPLVIVDRITTSGSQLPRNGPETSGEG